MAERGTMTDRAPQPSPESPLPPPRAGGGSAVPSHDSDQFFRPDPALRPDPPSRADSAGPGGHPVGSALHQHAVAFSEPLAIGVTEDLPVSGAGFWRTGRTLRIGDRVFLGVSSGAATLVILVVVLIAAFLVIKAAPSIANDKVNFLTSTQWSPTPGNLRFGIANLLWVTVIISLVAMVLAVPVAIGIALFVTQYAPARLAAPIAYVIDLLAAIPSIVYGIWGYTTLAPALAPVQRVLAHLPTPLFDLAYPVKTIFDGGVVLAVMVLPIVTAISREVFERTPRTNVEAALALGATRWEMIRMAVLPYGRAGVVSGSMLGLGRALGETIAVYLIVATASPPFHFSVFTGGETFASKIANGSSEFDNPQSTGAYIAAGLVLFVLTFAVNSAARAIVNRRRDFA
jgi:phosphate transport system permease protein